MYCFHSAVINLLPYRYLSYHVITQRTKQEKSHQGTKAYVWEAINLLAKSSRVICEDYGQDWIVMYIYTTQEDKTVKEAHAAPPTPSIWLQEVHYIAQKIHQMWLKWGKQLKISVMDKLRQHMNWTFMYTVARPCLIRTKRVPLLLFTTLCIPHVLGRLWLEVSFPSLNLKL